MADWGQDDAVIAPAKPTTPKESWGQDDAVIKVDVRGFGDKESGKPSSSIFGDKVSTQTLSDLVTGEQAPKTTGLGTFAREAALAFPATAVGVSVGSSVATATAPFGPYVTIPATIVAGGAAGFAANYLEEEGLTALEESSPLAKKYMSMLNVDKATRDAGRKQNEYSALAGQLASAGPFVSTKTASTALSRSLAERGFSGTIQAGVGAGQRAATGEDQDLGKTLLEFGGGALLPGKLTTLGEKTVPPKFRAKEVPITPPPPGATPEQVEAFKARVKKEQDRRKVDNERFKPLNSTAVLKDGSKTFIETEASPNAFSTIGRMEHGEPISLIAKNEAGEEIGRLTYMPDGGPIDVFVREQNRRKGVANALYDAHEAAGGKLPPVESGMIISNDARALRASREAKAAEAAKGRPSDLAYPNSDTYPINNDQISLLKDNPWGKTILDKVTAAGKSVEDFNAWLVNTLKSTRQVLFDEKHTEVPKELWNQMNKLSPEEWSKKRGYSKEEIDNWNKNQKDVQQGVDKFGLNYDDIAGLVNDPKDHPDYGTMWEKNTHPKQINLAAKKSPEIISSTGEIITDRTKTSPRDVKDDKEFLSIATDIYEKHGEVEAVEFFKGWEEFKKTWPEPVKQVEEFVGTNLNNKLANERIVHNNTADLKKLAGKDVDLEKLSFDIDSGVPLEGKAKDIADRFRTLMDDLGQQALESGVIKGWHENYVARNVVSEGNAPKGALEEFMRDAFGYGDKASGGGTKTTTKYGQERRLKTREDLTNHINGINTWLEQNGKDYRFKLKTNDLAEIYKDYALSVEKAIENKNLIDNIKQIRNANGESLIRPITKEDPRPYNWETIEHADLDGYAIHPDLVPALKFVFDSGPGMTMEALGTVSQAVKRINVIGSFFHAKSLMEVLSSAKIPLWTPLKEAIVLPLVEKGVKAVTGKDLQLSAITKAVEQYKKGGLGENVDRWIREDGLQLEVPEDVSRGMLSSIGKFGDTMIGKYGPKTRVLEKSMSTVEKYTLGIFDKYTWDYLHTGGKIMVADSYLEKARLQAAKEGKPFDESASRKEIAQFVNDSFGGLNWFDAARRTEGEFAKRMAMAAYSPEGRRAMQVLLFAPDWTTSTIRAFTAALPKSLNPTKLQPIEGIKGMINPTTKVDYARLYQFKTAVLYLTLLNVINNMTAGRDIWDNKDPTRIEWPDGTSMQAMKHAMEPYHWIAAPDKTLANKLGFIPKATVIAIAGTEYASPNAPKLVDMGATGRLKAIGQSALPFQIQAGIGAPEGEGVKRAVLGTAGFPVYGSTPEQRKQKKKERETQLKANAAAYHKKAKEKGWEQ